MHPHRRRKPTSGLRPGDTLGRALLSLLWGASLLVGCTSFEPPSIVLVTLDTTRADHLGCYGYFRDTSPVLDSLAGEGVLFENALTPMASTLPAHVSLLTSTSTLRHGVKANFDRLKRRFEPGASPPSFAEVVRDLGYETAAFVSAATLKDHTGIQAGFRTFDQPEAFHRVAAQTTDEVVRWLRSNGARPFFLWVHYFDPHLPYDPPPPFGERFATGDGLIGFLAERKVPRRLAGASNLYDGEIAYMDEQIGKLFAALREVGAWNGSAVVVAGDHGEGLGQHGWMSHGRIYNEQLRVPLIVKFPLGRGPISVRSDSLASLEDVVPTLVGVLNLPVPDGVREGFEGVDLVEGTESRPYVFSERTRSRGGWKPGRKYALTERSWKYFHLPEGRDELFHLESDPFESANVLDAHPEIASRMKRAILDELEREVTPVGQQRDEEMDPERIEQLRQLGYVE
jgi:arylsulfatase A-like enzyme